MANLDYRALPQGHIAQTIAPARQTITIALDTASYNYVKIYPAVVYIANTTNDGGVLINFPDGTSRLIPPQTNYRINVVGMNQLTIYNTGHIDIDVYSLDKAADSTTDVTIFAGAQKITSNDFVFHWDTTDSTTKYINSGVEPFFTMSATGGNSTAPKFGGSALRLSGTSQVILTAGQFFNTGKQSVCDFWINAVTNPPVVNTVPIRFANSLGGSLELFIFTSTLYRWRQNGSSIISFNIPFAAQTWNFMRVIFTGNDMLIYFNGTPITTNIGNFTPEVYDSITFSANSLMVMDFDEFRYNIGLLPDDYTSVPIAPFYN